MLEHLGATVRRVERPFDPEGGAYADPIARIEECYSNGITDEFIILAVIIAAMKPST